MENFILDVISAESKSSLDPSVYKVNIHFPVRGKFNKYCLELNAKINAVTKNWIKFDDYHIPHLTLAMGNISSQDIKKLISILDLFCRGQRIQKISPLRPKALNNEETYILTHIVEINEVLSVKKELNNLLGELVKPLRDDIVSTAHITVGYIEQQQRAVNKILAMQEAPPPWNADAIEISFCGNKGVSFSPIKIFELI